MFCCQYQLRALDTDAPRITELRDTIASDAEVDNADDGQADVQPDKVTILDALVAFCQQL